MATAQFGFESDFLAAVFMKRDLQPARRLIVRGLDAAAYIYTHSAAAGNTLSLYEVEIIYTRRDTVKLAFAQCLCTQLYIGEIIIFLSFN